MPNAANPRELRTLGRLASKRERRFLEALAAVMHTPAGALVLMDREHGLLARAGINKSVFSSDALMMAHRTGRQDYGHELLALLAQADEARLLVIDAEARGLAQRDAADVEVSTAGVQA